MKKIIPCSLKRLGLLFLVLVAFATNSSYAQCNASAEPRFVCAGPGNLIVYTTASVLLDNGTTLTWTITGDSTGGARFVNNNSLTSTTTVSSGLFNSVAVLLGPLSGSTEVRMSLPGDPAGTGCAASVFTKVLVIQGSATPVDCPNDLTTVSITPGLTGTKLGTSDQIIQFPSLPGGCGQYTYNLVTSPGGVIVATNNTGTFPNVIPQDYVIRIRDCDGCTATSPVINGSPVTPSPLIATCPVNVDRPACASQTELEGIFQAWLATFSHTTGFPPVITVRDPDGVIVPLHAPNHCGGSITVTWRVTDRCNQTDTCSATFLVRDSLPPQITCAPGGNLPCNPEIPGPTAPQITSACPTLPYTYNDVVTGPMCAQVLTRTYTVTNECGQTATCDQVFRYRIDHVAPVLHDVPTGGYLGCNPANLPACDPRVTATDNCDEFPVAECSAGGITNEGCIYTQVITYSSMDSCGNRVSTPVGYSWKIDTTAPVVTCPGDRVLACNAPTPTPEVATALDNCDGSLPTTAAVGTIEVDGCNRTLRITYSATDACENTGSCVQTFRWTVNTTIPVIVLDLAPTLGVDPTPAQIEAALGTAHINSPCGATLTATTGPIVEVSPCVFRQTRTWNGIDDCDNRAVQVERTVNWTTSGCNPPNGCTLGYWKNHTQAWDCYTTCTLYSSVFSGSTMPAGLTLLQALNLGGNSGCENLARQSVAALLNICDGTLNYSVADIGALQTLVNAAFANGTCTGAGALLDRYNNLGGANHCNVVKSPNTTVQSPSCIAPKKGVNATGKVAPSSTFTVYPNPFRNTFSINSTTISPINMSIYDVLGRSVETRTITPDEFDSPLFGRDYPTGMYNIILNQATEQKTVRVIKQ